MGRRRLAMRALTLLLLLASCSMLTAEKSAADNIAEVVLSHHPDLREALSSEKCAASATTMQQCATESSLWHDFVSRVCTRHASARKSENENPAERCASQLTEARRKLEQQSKEMAALSSTAKKEAVSSTVKKEGSPGTLGRRLSCPETTALKAAMTETQEKVKQMSSEAKKELAAKFSEARVSKTADKANKWAHSKTAKEEKEKKEEKEEKEEKEDAGSCDETMKDKKGAGYRGCQDKTLNGYTCMSWAKQSPHTHKNTPSAKKGSGLTDGKGNYCRNPPERHQGETIWCYTTSKSKRWDLCLAKGPIQADKVPKTILNAVLNAKAARSLCKRRDAMNKRVANPAKCFDPRCRGKPDCKSDGCLDCHAWKGMVSSHTRATGCNHIWKKADCGAENLPPADDTRRRTCNKHPDRFTNGGFTSKYKFMHKRRQKARKGCCIEKCEQLGCGDAYLQEVTHPRDARYLVASLMPGQEARGIENIKFKRGYCMRFDHPEAFNQAVSCSPGLSSSWKGNKFSQGARVTVCTKAGVLPLRNTHAVHGTPKCRSDRGSTHATCGYLYDKPCCNNRKRFPNMPASEYRSFARGRGKLFDAYRREWGRKLCAYCKKYGTRRYPGSRFTWGNCRGAYQWALRDCTKWERKPGSRSSRGQGREQGSRSRPVKKRANTKCTMFKARRLCGRHPKVVRWCKKTCTGRGADHPAWSRPVNPMKKRSAGCDERLRGRKSIHYKGCQTKTRSGRTCQHWAAQSPHRHGRKGRKCHGRCKRNYCRNFPGDSAKTIWCYTTSRRKRWEYCRPAMKLGENRRTREKGKGASGKRKGGQAVDKSGKRVNRYRRTELGLVQCPYGKPLRDKNGKRNCARRDRCDTACVNRQPLRRNGRRDPRGPFYEQPLVAYDLRYHDTRYTRNKARNRRRYRFSPKLTAQDWDKCKEDGPPGYCGKAAILVFKRVVCAPVKSKRGLIKCHEFKTAKCFTCADEMWGPNPSQADLRRFVRHCKNPRLCTDPKFRGAAQEALMAAARDSTSGF